ncbi:MAG: acetyl-CoA carboxylase biotin carboxyl carrier protein subunit, partial [Nitrosopumilaceae archaeon]
MEFRIENLGQKFDAELVQNLGNSEYIIKIQGKERNLKILNMASDKIEFMLDNTYHVAKYLDN